jgi:hypothetical protein
MNSLNFLYASLGIGFLVLVGFISYAFFNLSQALKQSTSILKKVDDITKDVNNLKNLIKSGILYLLSMFNKKEVKKNDNKK